MSLILPVPVQAAVQGISGVPQTLVVPAGVWAATVARL